eukprot:g1946.t1
MARTSVNARLVHALTEQLRGLLSENAHLHNEVLLRLPRLKTAIVFHEGFDGSDEQGADHPICSAECRQQYDRALATGIVHQAPVGWSAEDQEEAGWNWPRTEIPVAPVEFSSDCRAMTTRLARIGGCSTPLADEVVLAMNNSDQCSLNQADCAGIPRRIVGWSAGSRTGALAQINQISGTGIAALGAFEGASAEATVASTMMVHMLGNPQQRKGQITALDHVLATSPCVYAFQGNMRGSLRRCWLSIRLAAADLEELGRFLANQDIQTRKKPKGMTEKNIKDRPQAGHWKLGVRVANDAATQAKKKHRVRDELRAEGRQCEPAASKQIGADFTDEQYALARRRMMRTFGGDAVMEDAGGDAKMEVSDDDEEYESEGVGDDESESDEDCSDDSCMSTEEGTNMTYVQKLRTIKGMLEDAIAVGEGRLPADPAVRPAADDGELLSDEGIEGGGVDAEGKVGDGQVPIGKVVGVHWPEDKRWFDAEVIGHKGSEHEIVYLEDGVEESINFAEHAVKVIGDRDDGLYCFFGAQVPEATITAHHDQGTRILNAFVTKGVGAGATFFNRARSLLSVHAGGSGMPSDPRTPEYPITEDKVFYLLAAYDGSLSAFDYDFSNSTEEARTALNLGENVRCWHARWSLTHACEAVERELVAVQKHISEGGALGLGDGEWREIEMLGPADGLVAGISGDRQVGLIDNQQLLLDEDLTTTASAISASGTDGTNQHDSVQQRKFDAGAADGGGDRVEMGIREALSTVDMWLIIWCTFSTTGAHSIVQINIAQVCEAYGLEAVNTAAINMMLVGAAIGRVGVSVMIEFLRLYQRPRVLSFAIVSGCELAAMLLLATATKGGLLIGVFVSGFCYGAYWTLLPTAIADLFGLANLGVNYKASTLGEAAGYLLFGRWLAAHLYQQHIRHSPAPSSHSSNSCVGSACFRTTFLIGAASCLSAIVASAYLSVRPLSKTSQQRYSLEMSAKLMGEGSGEEQYIDLPARTRGRGEAERGGGGGGGSEPQQPAAPPAELLECSDVDYHEL